MGPSASRRVVLTAVALVGTLSATGADPVVAHNLLAPQSDSGREIETLWWIMLILSTVIFAVVLALLLTALLRSRGADVPASPGVARRFVLWGGVVVPAAVLLGLFVLTLRALPEEAPASSGDGELELRIVGRQWFWDLEYRGADSVRVRTANEIHIPAGRTVRVRARSGDVLHSLWIPQLNRKFDLFPGRTTTLTLRADEPGVYGGECAEFCGAQHARMGVIVVADEPAEFDRWLAANARPAAVPDTPQEKRGEQVFLGSSCVYCHRVAGTNATGMVGPDLTHLASRRSLGSALIPNRKGYLAGWILDPQHIKPGNKMPGTDLSGPELQQLLAYLESLR